MSPKPFREPKWHIHLRVDRQTRDLLRFCSLEVGSRSLNEFAADALYAYCRHLVNKPEWVKRAKERLEEKIQWHQHFPPTNDDDTWPDDLEVPKRPEGS